MKRLMKGLLLIGLACTCLSGCKASEKMEASIPFVSGTNVVQAATINDASVLYGTQWKNGFITLTISKDGKVHSETLYGDSKTGEVQLDTEGNPCLRSASDGYVDGGYIIWTEGTEYEYDYVATSTDLNGPVLFKPKGEVTRSQVSCSLLKYISDKTLILNETNTYIRVQ